MVTKDALDRAWRAATRCVFICQTLSRSHELLGSETFTMSEVRDRVAVAVEGLEEWHIEAMVCITGQIGRHILEGLAKHRAPQIIKFERGGTTVAKELTYHQAAKIAAHEALWAPLSATLDGVPILRLLSKETADKLEVVNRDLCVLSIDAARCFPELPTAESLRRSYTLAAFLRYLQGEELEICLKGMLGEWAENQLVGEDWGNQLDIELAYAKAICPDNWPNGSADPPLPPEEIVANALKEAGIGTDEALERYAKAAKKRTSGMSPDSISETVEGFDNGPAVSSALSRMRNAAKFMNDEGLHNEQVAKALKLTTDELAQLRSLARKPSAK